MFEFYKAALEGVASTPLCTEYKSAWRRCGDDKGMLIRLSLSQQAIPFVVTHAYLGNGITKDYIKNSFKDYINGKVIMGCDGVEGYTYSLYADWDGSNNLVINTDVTSIMWTKDACVVVPETKCPTVYVSNESDIHLSCEGYNSVNIKLFDRSKVTIEDLDEESNVVVYKYSKDASVELGKYCLGKVKVFNKELKI